MPMSDQAFDEDGQPTKSTEFPFSQVDSDLGYDRGNPLAAEIERESTGRTIEAIARMLELITSTDNPKLTIDCLLYASSAFIDEPLTIGDICRRHKISPNSAHVRIRKLWGKLQLPRTSKSVGHLKGKKHAKK